MNNAPVISIHCSSEEWSNLGATTKGIVEGETLKMPVQVGRNDLASFLTIDVEEITDDTIRFRAAGYNYILRKGESGVCVTYTIGGYTDHEGCDWDGTDYNYFLSWE